MNWLIILIIIITFVISIASILIILYQRNYLSLIITGPSGSNGSTGSPGSSNGSLGPTGPTGSPQGITGTIGTKGSIGPNGIIGPVGTLNTNLRDLPIGSIILYSGPYTETIQNYYFICDGSLVPVNDDTRALFNLITTDYGGGSTQFRLPNLRSKIPVGINITFKYTTAGGDHLITNDNIPAHRHSISKVNMNYLGPGFSGTNTALVQGNNLNGGNTQIFIPNTTATNTTQHSPYHQPYLALTYLIRYR